MSYQLKEEVRVTKSGKPDRRYGKREGDLLPASYRLGTSKPGPKKKRGPNKKTTKPGGTKATIQPDKYPPQTRKTTVFQEIIREGFENQVQKDATKVIRVLLDKAIEGDMQAMKMVMDRIVPVGKAIDLDGLDKGKGLSININIGNLEDSIEVQSAEAEEFIVSEQ